MLDLKDHFISLTQQVISDERHKIELAAYRFQPLVNKALANKKQYQVEAAQRLQFATRNYFDRQNAYYTHVKESVHYLTKKHTRSARQKNEFLATRLKLELSGFFKNQKQKLKLLDRTVEISDPKKVIERGYSLTYHEETLVKDLSTIKIGNLLLTQTKDGKILSRVEKISPEK